MAIVVPDIACLREPNLLIPGKAPVGMVQVDGSNTIGAMQEASYVFSRGVVHDAKNGSLISNPNCGFDANAATFNGTSQRITVPLNFTGIASLSIVCDFFINSLSLAQTICSNWGAEGYRQYVLSINTDGSISWGTYNSSSNVYIKKTNPSVLTAGRRFRVVATWKPGIVDLFVNGVNTPAPNDAWVAGNCTSIASSSGADYIGGRNDNVKYLDGKVYFASFSKKHFSSTVAQSLSVNPYQFLIPA